MISMFEKLVSIATLVFVKFILNVVLDIKRTHGIIKFY